MNAKLPSALLLAISMLGAGTVAYADERQVSTLHNKNTRVIASHSADNTGMNIRDRNNEKAKTADSVVTSIDERELTASIRRAIVKDDSLSTYAHNVKIIVEHGKVTLRGPVHSAAERENIGKKTAELAGKLTVDNQLEVVEKQ